jgi:hypothetical protein
LTVCTVGSCAPRQAPVFVTPQLELPPRPDLFPVVWQHDLEAGTHTVTTEEARKLNINDSRLKRHIEILEGYITAVGGQ